MADPIFFAQELREEARARADFQGDAALGRGLGRLGDRARVGLIACIIMKHRREPGLAREMRHLVVAVVFEPS